MRYHTDLLERARHIPPGHPFWAQLKVVLDDAEKEAAQGTAIPTDGTNAASGHESHLHGSMAGGAMQGGNHEL